MSNILSFDLGIAWYYAKKHTTRTTAKLSGGVANSLYTYTSDLSSTHKDPTSSIPAVSWETLLSDTDSCFDSFSLLSGSNLGRTAQGNRMRDARRDAVCAFDLTLIPWCGISLEVWFSLSGRGTTFPPFSSFHLKTNSLLFFYSCALVLERFLLNALAECFNQNTILSIVEERGTRKYRGGTL